MKLLLTSIALVSAMFIAGCQMPGKVVGKTEACPLCPKCQSVTTTGLIKGTTVTTVFCPDCKAEYNDPRLMEYLPAESSVFCCKKCKINVKTCKACEK